MRAMPDAAPAPLHAGEPAAAFAPERPIVVIPTFNEAENIGRLVERLLQLPVGAEVLVVDDSSQDGTAKIVREAGETAPGRVHLLERPGKAGLGAAYVAGFGWVLAQGRYDSVVQMDADFSHDPDDVVRLLAALGAADICIGSRYVHGGGVIDWSLRREALSRWGNAYARIVLGIGVRDLTGGFKAWRTSTLATLDWSVCSASGYGFQIQTTIQAVCRGAKVVEVPIIFRDREQGQSKMHGGIVTEALVGVVRLRWSHRKELRAVRNGRRSRSS
jgi:dolichol-phosphate mannosyltransferase